jgi:hypothetical protein
MDAGAATPVPGTALVPRPRRWSETVWGRVVDTTLGAGAVTEQLVAGGVALAAGAGRLAAQLPPMRAAAEGGARIIEPLTERGRAARSQAWATATGLVRTQVPRLVDVVLDFIDLDSVLARVDVDGIIQRVDVDSVVRRVDVQRIIDRVDVDAIVQRVDVEGVVERVNIDAIVGNTEVGSLIVRSTSGAAAEVLDVVRSQGVGLDAFVFRVVNRVLRRDAESLPVAPSPLAVANEDTEIDAHETVEGEDTGPDGDA